MKYWVFSSPAFIMEEIKHYVLEWDTFVFDF